MANLDSALFQEVVDWLIPFMIDEDERRSIVRLALTPAALRRLKLSGPADSFTVQMVSTLLQYGEVVPGKPAVIALLDTLRNNVGVDRQAEIDQLQSKLMMQLQQQPVPLTPQQSLSVVANAVALPSVGTPIPPRQTAKDYYGKSWAIVVGINQYAGQQQPLKNACNDAVGFAQVVTASGFEEVHTLYDKQATRHAILHWLRDELPQRTGSEDRVIFFFAGHGVTQREARGGQRGYLVPYDGDSFANFIVMEELRQACGLIKAKHILIVLDCCFSGVAAIMTRNLYPVEQTVTDRFLTEITKRGAWQILTAGAEDQVVADSGKRPDHSAFTSALLDGLAGAADHDRDGIITATSLANYVIPTVTRETAIAGRPGQKPVFSYLAGSEQGDFVFLGPFAT